MGIGMRGNIAFPDNWHAQGGCRRLSSASSATSRRRGGRTAVPASGPAQPRNAMSIEHHSPNVTVPGASVVERA